MQSLEPLDILCHCEFVKTPRELTFGHHCALLTLSLFFFQSSAVVSSCRRLANSDSSVPFSPFPGFHVCGVTRCDGYS